MFFLLYYRVGTGSYSVFSQNELQPNPVGIYKTITYPEPEPEPLGSGPDDLGWLSKVGSSGFAQPSCEKNQP